MEFVIADDHPIFRSGLKALLVNAYPDAKINEFADGEEAGKFITEHAPQMAFLDIDMPRKNGLELTRELAAASTTRLVILTMYNDGEMLRKAMDSGAHAYLVKDNTSDELVACINAVMRGENYVARSLRRSPKIQRELREYQSIIKKLETLTAAELKTLQLVGKKHSSKAIADLLFVSNKSVENYRSRICKKLELNARNNSLLIWVLEHKNIIEEFSKNGK